ncbi:hypothetical protein LOK49_LG02G00129 [Camellia lanceoleosa]|uniref:Uncharacterized protein n=1 Tax=Camellia lanceoleosa TaxID=1840588 RepID=A0ACC0IQH1_9ERIC|nr:hypothetical protein LOK49_LG02G00129 [Camellia lanceoleosa]
MVNKELRVHDAIRSTIYRSPPSRLSLSKDHRITIITVKFKLLPLSKPKTLRRKAAIIEASSGPCGFLAYHDICLWMALDLISSSLYLKGGQKNMS